MLLPTIPEPKCDIAAQFRAMLDPKNPKDAVFVSAGNEAAIPAHPAYVYTVRRSGGVLFTTNPEKAATFSAGVDEAGMAKILGYIEPKAEITGDFTVVQVLDGAGAVVIEAAVSLPRLSDAMKAFARYVPPGGSIAEIAPLSAIGRRALLCAQEARR